MPWESYRKTYYNYLLSIAQGRLLTLVAGKVFKDFPKGLPKSMTEPLIRDVKVARDAMLELMAAARSGERSPPILYEIETDIFEPTSQMVLAHSVLGEVPDFARMLLSQELVMLFAHLDAFMADSVRIICQVRPEILKRGKTIEWKAVLACGGWEELLNHLVERYVYEAGWESVRKRIEFLRREIGLETEFPEANLKRIDEAENTRNIVIHNGSRVNREYIDKTGRSDVTAGELVPLTGEYLEGIYVEIRALASALMESIARKFFDVQPSSLPVRYYPKEKVKVVLEEVKVVRGEMEGVGDTRE